MTIEDERKYFIRDANTFNGILAALRLQNEGGVPPRIGRFEVRDSYSKSRNYRYFDTFDRHLEREQGMVGVGLLESERGSASLRDRGKDYVLALKIPTGEEERREELEQAIAAEAGDFYELDPIKYLMPDQREYIERLCGRRRLAEVVRLTVQTHRFDLYAGEAHRAHVSVDDVTAEVSTGGPKQNFHELEIELMKDGESSDKSGIALYFLDRYGAGLVRSSLPKWIKALRLVRGEEIMPDTST